MTDTHDMHPRIEFLEKQVRSLRMLGGIVIALAFSFLLMGQATNQAKTVEAQKFILRDVNGVQRATLSASDGMAALSLYDADENVRARLLAGKRPALVFFDAENLGEFAKLRLALGVGDMGGGDTDSGPHLMLFDEAGISRVEMFVTEPKSGLVVYDKDGEVIFGGS